jgi:hypothetical protein
VDFCCVWIYLHPVYFCIWENLWISAVAESIWILSIYVPVSRCGFQLCQNLFESILFLYLRAYVGFQLCLNLFEFILFCTWEVWISAVPESIWIHCISVSERICRFQLCLNLFESILFLYLRAYVGFQLCLNLFESFLFMYLWVGVDFSCVRIYLNPFYFFTWEHMLDFSCGWIYLNPFYLCTCE